jgi:hypothetical protein
MSIAKDINDKLDDILSIRAEIKKMKKEVSDDAVLTNMQTGEKANKDDAIRVAESVIDHIKFDLNQITNNGLNVNEIFTNKFYVNDMMQDREIARQINEEKNKSNSFAPSSINTHNEIEGSDAVSN